MKNIFKNRAKLLSLTLGIVLAFSLASCSHKPTLLEDWKSRGKVPSTMSMDDFCDSFYLRSTEFAWDWWDFTRNMSDFSNETYSWNPKNKPLDLFAQTYVLYDKKNLDSNELRDSLYRLYEMASRFFNAQNMITTKSRKSDESVSFFDLGFNTFRFTDIPFSSNVKNMVAFQSKFVTDFHNARKEICSVPYDDFLVDKVESKITLQSLDKLDLYKLNQNLNTLLRYYELNLPEVNKIWRRYQINQGKFAELMNYNPTVPDCKEYKTSNPKYVVVKCTNLP